MTWHRFFRNSLILGLVFLGLAPQRPALSATLPSDVRSATNAAAVKPKVLAFLEPKVADLASPEANVRSAARDAIMAEVLSGGAIPGAGGAAPAAGGSGGPSAAFLDAYADVLAEKFDPLITHADPRIRLNVAVITARVAEKANNQRLMPIVVKMLADENEAIVLWGIKGTRYIIPTLLNSALTARTNPLVPAFTEAAKAHIKSGAIVQSAYDALRIEQTPTGVNSAQWASAVQVVAPVMQELMALRLDQYKDSTPEIPQAETAATTFLTDEKVWKGQSPPSQLRTVQLTVNLITMVAERLESVGTVEGGELRTIIRKSAGALTVVGRWVGQQSQMDAAVSNLTKIGAGTAADKIVGDANALVPALNKIKGFSGIQPPGKQP